MSTAQPAVRRRVNSAAHQSSWENVSKTLIVLALLLTPVVVSSSLSDSWEQPKTLVLAGLISLAWVSYLLSSFQSRRVDWTWHPLDWFVSLLALGAVVSSLMSVHLMSSLWGIGSWVNASLPATLSFVSVYVLVSRLFRTHHDRLIAWSCLLTGTGGALLLTMFQLSGVPLLPGLFQSNQMLGPVSSSASQSAVVAAMFGTAALLLWSYARERWARWAIVAGVVLSWLVLLFLRQPLGWTVFAIGMVVVVMQQTRQTNVNNRLVVIAVIIAAAGILLQVTGLSTFSHLPSTNDVLLDQRTSASTMWTTFLHRPVTGSGPSTWFHDFVQYRPQSFNSSPNWSLRFVKAAGEWEQQVATGGIVMVGLWFGLLGLAAWWLWRQRQLSSLTISATLFVVVITWVLGWLTTWSWVLLLWLWVGLGLTRSKLAARSTSTPMGAMVPVGLMIVLLVGGWYWWSAGRVTASDVYFKHGQTLYNQTAPIDSVVSALTRSAQLNPKNGNALVLLAQAEATRAVLQLQNGNSTDVAALMQPTLTHLRQAIATDPHNPVLLEDMNNLLNRLSGLVNDVASEANQNFKTLETIEPTSPIHDVGEGQTDLVIRDSLSALSSTAVEAQRQALLTEALTAFRRALTKKPDYSQGKFAYAQALDAAGKSDQALALLTELKTSFGQVGQYWVEVAIVDNHLKQSDQADQAFAQAVTLSAQDPSIYLSWANDLADNGNKEKAKKILEQGVKAVSDTTQLQSRLDELKK